MVNGMKKILKKSTTINIILGLLLIILGALALSQYNERKNLENIIDELNKELDSEREYNEIYANTKRFIELSGNANHSALLTGKAKEEFEEALKNKGLNAQNHVEAIIEDVQILNVYGTKTGNETGESYAIYQIHYGNSDEYDTPLAMQRVLTLSLHAKWEKVDNTYKVYDYQIHLLEDSLDKYLRELAQEYEDDVEDEVN